MLRKLSFLAAVAWFAVAAGPVRAQDPQPEQQPSLADAARQARKDKDKDKDKSADKTAPKAVITDENLSAGVAGAKSSGAAGTGASASASANASGAGKSEAIDAQRARLEVTEASLDQLEPLSRSELATTVLHGNTADFPGRAEWEERLYEAKGQYLVRSRQLISAMNQTLADMEALQSGDPKIAPNDPRVQALSGKARQIMQLAARTENAFQQVVKEGQNLAAASPAK